LPPRPKKKPASPEVLPSVKAQDALPLLFRYGHVSALVTVPLPRREIIQTDPQLGRTYTSLEWYWPTFEKPLTVRFDAMTPQTRVLLGHACINSASGSFQIDWYVPPDVPWALSIRDADADLEILGPPVTVILRGITSHIVEVG